LGQGLGAVAGAVFVIQLPGYFRTLFGRLRAVPYFAQPVSGPDTYSSGEALLLNSRAIDSYLTAHGLTPFSSFSSGDDFRGELLFWHDPQEALNVAERLLAAIGDGDLSLENAPGVTHDLELLIAKLQNAAQSKVGFCLLLRDNRGTNHREHAMRVGTFFDVCPHA
jgi:hypothetical protein